ncbi:MAG: DUF817 domain-containing protein [Pseudoruegeria sp.]
MQTPLYDNFHRAISIPLRQKLPHRLSEFAILIAKLLWAALFGILFLLALIVTRAIWQPDWALNRYDALLIYALCVQALMLWSGAESWDEAKVIFLFHLTGTTMEIFKVNAGSWTYPHDALMMIKGVPLFTGFMYASVGSTIARMIHLFQIRFAPYPPYGLTLLLAASIYINFYSHHFLPDIRNILFVATLVLFWRTRMWMYVSEHPYWVPLPIAIFLASFALWVAENVGTLSNTWTYAGQQSLQLVSLSKMGSWYLLLYVSFVTVTLVFRDMLIKTPLQPDRLKGSLSPKQ